jgi:acyl-CoA hydrolase
MPRTLGDAHLHVSKIDVMLHEERELPKVRYAPDGDPVAARIGERVAELVEDGSTLQLGIGAIPDAVLRYLGHHKGLGVHTEMFSDGVIPLDEKGVITNEHKKVARGKLVTTFVLGTRKLYDFVGDNPLVAFHDVS